MTIYDWSKVPAKLWAELGHELCAADRWSDMRLELQRAVQAVQAAAETRAPLRTRAEVDAELGRLCRQYYAGGLASQQSLLSIHERLKVVSHERVADPAPETYGPRGVDDRGFPPGRDPATGATSSTDDLPDPEPCGCEEAEALKDRLSERGKVIGAAYDLAKQLHDLLVETP